MSDWLTVLLTPGCWLQNDPYSREWDRELTWLIDHGHKFVRMGRYNAQIGPYEVWVSNHPYASFTIDAVRPRRATILRAGALLPPLPSEQRRDFPLHRERAEVA